MIQLHTDCLVFKTSSGECIPCKAEDMTIELLGDAAYELESQMVEEAAAAVLYYFKEEQSRTTVTVAEFTEALERILRGFGHKVIPAHDESAPAVPHAETDLTDLAMKMSEGLEMVFFCALRNRIHATLHGEAQALRVRGLRDCVKQLTGAKRWSPRCQKLNDQIVDHLRQLIATRRSGAKFTLMIV